MEAPRFSLALFSLTAVHVVTKILQWSGASKVFARDMSVVLDDWAALPAAQLVWIARPTGPQPLFVRNPQLPR